MQLFGDSGTLSFVRTCQLNWSGHFNRMYSKRKVKYLTIVLREANKRIAKKTDSGIVYKQILINAK